MTEIGVNINPEMLDNFISLLKSCRRIAAFTGAGISTESGIPDFRGPSGTWEKFDPNEFHIDRFVSSVESRRKYWLHNTGMYEAIRQAAPNAAHVALTRLHGMGRLSAVITQNIDGMHQVAGMPDDKVIELHGSTRYIGCLSCGIRIPRQEFQHRVSPEGDSPPCDSCGGLMKPATISFGQMLTPESMEAAARETDTCDLFVVIGSSLVVYPAAGFPVHAARRGVPLVIINNDPTPHDEYAQVVLNAPAGEVFRRAMAVVDPDGPPLSGVRPS
ncbi:MAG: Sir2 family NAD-dependent protein deacetylase [Deltaproteobacteria bacterium]|nr:Sir2 family NAD-dependent protein deacetylase [Deltaproteobacteria bacterium]